MERIEDQFALAGLDVTVGHHHHAAAIGAHAILGYQLVFTAQHAYFNFRQFNLVSALVIDPEVQVQVLGALALLDQGLGRMDRHRDRYGGRGPGAGTDAQEAQDTQGAMTMVEHDDFLPVCVVDAFDRRHCSKCRAPLGRACDELHKQRPGMQACFSVQTWRPR